MKAKKVKVFDFGLVCLKFKAKCVCVRVLSGRKRSLFVAVGEERGKERNMICDDDMYCVGG